MQEEQAYKTEATLKGKFKASLLGEICLWPRWNERTNTFFS